MKRIILALCLLLMLFGKTSANYSLEDGSKELVKKYNFHTTKLGEEITRKEFVENLYIWYKEYKSKKGIKIDYSNYKKIDNAKYFRDIDLDSHFGKKLAYFAYIGAFSKREYFAPNDKLPQRDFFIVMKRLKILYSLQGCKNLRICEKEVDGNTYFTKGVYYRYVSKILDKKLRVYHNSPIDYIKDGYKPFLSPNYHFPLRGQTLNGCYPFSIRNILKYKYGIGIYVSRAEKNIKKAGKDLWTAYLMNKFDNIAHVKKKDFYHIDTLITSLQAGEPMAITYYLDYYSYKERKMKKVLHIVAAYSFDEKGIWVAETVSGTRKRIAWNKVFNKYGQVNQRRMFKYYYAPSSNWSLKQKSFEKKHNILVGEF